MGCWGESMAGYLNPQASRHCLKSLLMFAVLTEGEPMMGCGQTSGALARPNIRPKPATQFTSVCVSDLITPVIFHKKACDRLIHYLEIKYYLSFIDTIVQ